MKFGSVIKEARLNAGMSQEELAELMYMPRSKVSKLENDKVELKVTDFTRWLQVTQFPEAATSLVCGVDLVALTQMLTTLVGGFIKLT